MAPGLITEIRVLDQVLAEDTNQLGTDFVSYRNHAYHVANLRVMLAPPGRNQIEKIVIEQHSTIWASGRTKPLTTSNHPSV